MKRFSRRLCWLCPGLLAVALVTVTANGVFGQEVQSSPDNRSEAQLIGVLQSDASHYQKLLACKRLARVGTEASVPILASMLSDKELSYPARIALEAIHDAAVGKALREAVSELEGELLIGVIHSIGARRDPDAIDTLEELLARSETDVAVAAAWAIGSVGTPAAAWIAMKGLAGASPEVQEASGDACLRCAEVARDRRVAARLYDVLQQAKLPDHIRLAAVRGAILADESNRNDLLNGLLGAEDRAAFAMALSVSRELPEAGVTRLLMEQYANLSADRQALLVLALGDRNDPAALPKVTEAAQSDVVEVRLAAIRALSKLGDASTLPLLLEAASAANEEVAGTALDTLAVMRDPGVDAAITAQLQQLKDDPPEYLLDLAGRRRITAAAPIVLKAADSSNKSIRMAAIKALGETMPADRVAFLRDRLLTTGDSEEATAAEQALRAACVRLAGENGEETASQLVAVLPKVAAEKKTLVLDLLRIVGGKTALKAVSEAALSDDTALQDTGTRILGEWMTPDAAPSLLTVSEKLGNSKFGIRAMRGYIRIIRQFDVPDDERLSMCRKGLDLAQRDDERRLLLDALGRIPQIESLKLIEAYLDTAPLKEAACAAAVNVAERIGGDGKSEDVVRVMRKVAKSAGNEEVVSRARELVP